VIGSWTYETFDVLPAIPLRKAWTTDSLSNGL
jgi:hypothetical protein